MVRTMTEQITMTVGGGAETKYSNWTQDFEMLHLATPTDTNLQEWLKPDNHNYSAITCNKDGQYLYFSNTRVNWHYFTLASQAAWNRISSCCIPLAMFVGCKDPWSYRHFLTWRLISLGGIASLQVLSNLKSFPPNNMFRRNYAPSFPKDDPKVAGRFIICMGFHDFKLHLSICYSQEVVLRQTLEGAKVQLI